MSKNDKPVKTKYKKQSLLKSKLFKGVEKDLLNSLLEDDKEYSIEECESIIKKERGRMVK